MKHIFTWAILFLIVCYATPSDANNREPNHRFHNINKLYGISMRQASSVCKDHNNFAWVSTKLGILRLTSDNSHVYQLPYESPNVHNIELIYTDSVLWAISNNGQLFKYDQVLDKFLLEYNLDKNLNNRHLSVYSTIFQNSDTCWLATSDGLFLYSSNSKNAKKVISEAVISLEWYSQDQFFAVLLNEISLFDVVLHKKEILYSGLLNDYYFTCSLHFDKNRNRLWLGSNFQGLFYFDFAQKKLYAFKPDCFPCQPVMDIEEIDSETLLVGIDGQGIWSINQDLLSIGKIYKDDVDNPDALRGNGVYDIFHDKKKGFVWVCTFSGGVSYFYLGTSSSEHIIHHTNQENSLADNNVNYILEDSRKNLWFATDNGISVRKANGQEWSHFYTNNQKQAQVFLTLYEDRKGQIWAGSYSSGVYVIDAESGKQTAHYSQSEPNTPFKCNFVFSIYGDSYGDIWICGINSEVVRYMPDKDRFRKYFFQPATNIVQYNDSLMLLACSYGLVQLNKNSGVYSTLVGDNIVSDILVIGDKIWFGTGGNGLLCFHPDSNKVRQFTTENGLLSNHVNSIYFSDNQLWLGTENGLCSFSPKTEKVKTYSGLFSLLSLSFNTNAHCRLHDGRLAMGTNNGAVLFNPSEMSERNWVGRIFFQDLRIADRSIRNIPSFNLDKPVDMLENLEIRYRQNSFKLEVLSLGGVSKAKFSWKLEGLNNEWTKPSEHKLISYNNIPFGKYMLRVRMYDSALAQIIDERTLTVKVANPFWAQWWFFALMFFMISLIIYSVFWYLLNRIRHYQTEEKIRFFTNTAHEIRTSLTLIKAPVEELKNESNISESGKHFLSLANEQARHLNNVVNQLMDFHKIDVGKEKFKPEMVNLPSLILCRVEMYESLAAMKNIEFKNNFATKQYETAVDEIQMEKVVDNLISNAIKYSNNNSVIKIDFEGNDTHWTLKVSDQGIGIPKRDMKRLFKEFYRAQNAINSKIVGSGVGLLLVNNIVRLHNGNVTVTSQENHGSTFTVSIPYKKAPHVVRYQDNEDRKIIDNNISGINDFLPANEPETNGKKQKLLIVEDNDKLLRFMQVSFGKEYEVLTAPDGVAGWELIQNIVPDLVISDVMMPKMNGFELCENIKSTFETSHIPVVLLTALNDTDTQLHGLGLGADDYLTKPFDTKLLRQKIRTIIHNRKSIREKALRIIQTENNEPVLNNTHNDKFLKKMLEVVKANISNPQFSKDDFAAAMKVSGSLLYKKVKALTDLSPLEFIKSVRMGYALELLQSKKYSINEVSDMCGYASSGYFSTVFKRYFGKTPSGL
ncbi:MAG: response regulator [Prolixibacteraceae bacterium]|nr:response regulator [Prolixibacteraceae bacterium]